MHLHPWKFHEQEQPDKYTKINKTILNVAYFTMLWWRNQIRELPGASYRCECGSKANTFYRPPQDRNPLCNERATSNEILETLDFKGNEIFWNTTHLIPAHHRTFSNPHQRKKLDRLPIKSMKIYINFRNQWKALYPISFRKWSRNSNIITSLDNHKLSIFFFFPFFKVSC